MLFLCILSCLLYHLLKFKILLKFFIIIYCLMHLGFLKFPFKSRNGNFSFFSEKKILLNYLLGLISLILNNEYARLDYFHIYICL